MPLYEPPPLMHDELKSLAAKSIAAFAWEEKSSHNQEGCGDYVLSPELLDLLKEAKRLNVTIAPLYEGHIWPEV